MLTILLICMQTWSLTADESPSIWTLTDREEVIQSDSFTDTGRREAARSLKPLVELWTTANCPPCGRMKADVEGGCLYGASIVWNRGSRPDTSKGFPQCRVDDVAFVGWSESVKGRVREAAGLSEPTVKQSAPSHGELKALHDRLHGGGSWTWPGDLRRHLGTAHGVNLGQAIRTKPVQIQSAGSACPGGSCPQQPQRRGLFSFLRR